ncbi:TerD family protein [Streptomyces sp. NPDC091268]|uniref:TerD family protein n=1 Tax=Streptomyces sp. NPDC091268 TaxID=3365979 RepID=UPI00381679CC
MAAELVRGQNHALSEHRVRITVSAGTPVLALASLLDERGAVTGPEGVAHPGARDLPGVQAPGAAAARHGLEVDLDAVAARVHRVAVLLSLPPGGPVRFGAVAAPHVAVATADGRELAEYTVTGLEAETAVVALELYRRQGAWKVRAVGQGYADGLGALFADHGLAVPAARDLAARVHADAAVPAVPAPSEPAAVAPLGAAPGAVSRPGAPAPEPAPAPAPVPAAAAAPAVGAPAADTTISYAHPRRRPTGTEPPEPAPPAPPAPEPGEVPRPVAGDAAGWSLEERLYNQVWGMFEDLARAVAAYRGAVGFADTRMERELDEVLADPRHRLGGSAHAARDTARERRDELVGRARAVLDRDLAQLAAESEVVEAALPAPYARWAAPVWHGGGAGLPEEAPLALRLGDLYLPEQPDLRIPMLVRVPLERGLWIDNGRTGSEAAMAMDTDRLRRAALDMAVAHAARLLAVHPADRFSVRVIDAAGAGAASWAPLVRAGVLAAPPAAGAAGVEETLAALTRRVDLVQMAVRAGAPEDLPPDVDTADQLLIVHDFPHGFDDRAVTRLRYLADEGPAVGVHLLMVADRDEASAYGPLLDPLWRSLMRLSPVPDDQLADPWVHHAWTFEPDLPPQAGRVLEAVLERVAAARR